tara:strand:+ start:569 stop:745 length:177 start_codon:yes stop_codon:yes gene_type:complete
MKIKKNNHNPFDWQKKSAGVKRQNSEWSKPTWAMPINKKPMKGRFVDNPRAEEADKYG